MPPTVPAHVFNALKRFTSCDVGDALIKLNVRYGGYLHGLRMYSPTPQTCTTKILGPAYTVQMVDAADTTSPKPSQHFVDGVSKDAVVFISQPEGFYSACWGGLMTTRAKYLGAKGVVVDGNVRDLGEHREMGFPVFAKGTSALGSNTFTRASGLNVPVQFTSETQKRPLTINPGDLILADQDGVVVVPVEHAEKCLKICEERFEIDEKTMEALKNGEAMGDTLARLRK
ncbi:RraA-like protein [Aureobasidium namibiae CBS 147.97]|uniref:RraA-like protein n=1 Tax=Aureobasidium namibiae CBS 147.97 TaxID=1043004 RepID=A0A074X0H5_9PEZI